MKRVIDRGGEGDLIGNKWHEITECLREMPLLIQTSPRYGSITKNTTCNIHLSSNVVMLCDAQQTSTSDITHSRTHLPLWRYGPDRGQLGQHRAHVAHALLVGYGVEVQRRIANAVLSQE